VTTTPPAPSTSGWSLLDGLDPDQLRAVQAPPAPLVVVAGAGSGKTTTLTRRIAYQVLRGDVAPENVLAVTHTTKAAAEVRERLSRLDPALGAVTCMTVHAAAWKVLRQFAVEAGFAATPTLVSSTLSLVRTALRRVGKATVESTDVVDTAAEFEWAGAWGLSPEAYQAAASKAGRNPPFSLGDTAAVFAEYRAVKAEGNVVDFADVLAHATALLGDSVVGPRVRAVWQAVVVDEFQDTDQAQARFLAAIRAGRPLFVAVGDPRQTIYSFKGADPSLLRDAMREPGATVVHLATSWRCSTAVLSWANAVIGGTYGPKLVSPRSGPDPVVRIARDEDDEVEAVLNQVRAWRTKGVRLDEMAVLYRFNASAARLESAFADAGIAYQVLGAARFLDRPEVLEVLRWFGAEARLDGEQDGMELLRTATHRAGFDPDIPPASQGAARARWESMRALLEMGEHCADLSAAGMLDEFLAKSRTGTSFGVSLATIHAAKGLEWRAVVVVGLAEGTLPSSYASSAVEIEEERRLCYVAFTRAAELLTATVPQRFKRRPIRPSRFLANLPGVRLPASASSRGPRSSTGSTTSSKSRAGGTHRGAATTGARSGSWRDDEDRTAEELVEMARGESSAARGMAPPAGLVCAACGDRLSGLPARTANRCTPGCLDGVFADRWRHLVAWRAAAGASPAGKVTDRSLFRVAVLNTPGPGWPDGVSIPSTLPPLS
jgi:DNA helicase-2/ATP-dependent DNA helicase PcrA